MHVRRVVGHNVHNHFEAGVVRGGHHRVEIVECAEARIHVAVVDHVVAAIGQFGGVERRKPQGVHAQLAQVRYAACDAGDVAEPVAVRVAETAGVHLIDDGLLPPVVVRIVEGHAGPFHGGGGVAGQFIGLFAVEAARTACFSAGGACIEARWQTLSYECNHNKHIGNRSYLQTRQ